MILSLIETNDNVKAYICYKSDIMTDFLFIFLSGTTALIGLLHVYWAINGQWGRNQDIPTKSNGEALFQIGPFSCMVVAILMFGLSTFYIYYFRTILIALGDYERPKLYDIAILIIAFGFFIRAIGDFKYVGFFKSIRNTTFGRLDTKYFSPLCLILSLGSLALFKMTH